jgi:hypothetical protein
MSIESAVTDAYARPKVLSLKRVHSEIPRDVADKIGCVSVMDRWSTLPMHAAVAADKKEQHSIWLGEDPLIPSAQQRFKRHVSQLGKHLATTQPYDLTDMKDLFHAAGDWGIINMAGSCTRWHTDAAGAMTFFGVRSGKKLWIMRGAPGEGPVAVILHAGDLA